MDPLFTFLGAVSGATGLLLGAFASHGLRRRTTLDMLVTFETAVRYQIVHSLAIIVLAMAIVQRPDSPWLVAAAWLFLAGIAIFSGSLYLLVVTSSRRMGIAAPFGGLILLAGWIMIALSALF
jgi:uncharacterized membrane protein YgdD (TMEM256/DUF423 family)